MPSVINVTQFLIRVYSVNIMFVIWMLFLINQVNGRYYRESPTTKTYDIQVPGSTPIRIVEDEILWDDTDITSSTTARYKYDNKKNVEVADDFEENTESLKEYNEHADENGTTEDTAQALKNFLQSYSEKVRKKVNQNSGKRMEEVPLITKEEEPPKNRLASLYLDENERGKGKPKEWDLLHVDRHNHNHPYADRNGWISLEAVPWSVSKISKWQSNYQSQHNRPDEIDRNYNKNSWSQKPSQPSYNYPISDHSDKRYSDIYSRPTTSYNHKVHVHTERAPYQEHTYAGYGHKHNDNCHQDIITDGQPPNFPTNQHNDYNRRRGSSHDTLTESHPLNGDGEWILLSTTKGYKRQKPRERSMHDSNDTQSVSTHRSVRLTVLPPLKNSKVNMTTSHGGLLQVESTFQTVEQAQRAYVKRMKLKNKTTTTTHSPIITRRVKYKKPTRRVIKKKYKIRPQKFIQSNSTKPIMQTSDTSAVLAAVGAGMIPATMAMLVPMAISGKRKRRNIANEGYFRIKPNFIKSF